MFVLVDRERIYIESWIKLFFCRGLLIVSKLFILKNLYICSCKCRSFAVSKYFCRVNGVPSSCMIPFRYLARAIIYVCISFILKVSSII